MYYAVVALIVVVGLFLVTPAGARTSVDWRQLDRQGGPKRESGSRPDLVRNTRMAGLAMVIGAPMIMLMSLL